MHFAVLLQPPVAWLKGVGECHTVHFVSLHEEKTALHYIHQHWISH